MSYDDYHDAEREDLRREERAKQRYYRQLAAHPHPNDPDHPDDLEDEEEEEEEEEPDTRMCISCGGHIAQDGTLPCGH